VESSFFYLGPKRLPQLGRGMGAAITNFKKGLNEGAKEDENKDNNDEEKQA
jgi:TatA/E family protein of Tat protein translocase